MFVALCAPSQASVEEVLGILILIQLAEGAPTRVNLARQMQLVRGHDGSSEHGLADAPLVGGDVRVTLVVFECRINGASIHVLRSLQVRAALSHHSQLALADGCS